MSRTGQYLLYWALFLLTASALVIHGDLTRMEQDFDRDTRIAYRQLGERLAQNAAIIETLQLVHPADHYHGEGLHVLGRQLQQRYPYLQGVAAYTRESGWEGAEPREVKLLEAHLAQARKLGKPLMVQGLSSDPDYWLLGSRDDGHALALRISVRHLLDRDLIPAHLTRIWISLGKQQVDLMPVAPRPLAPVQNIELSKSLDAGQQHLELRALRVIGAFQLPWAPLFTLGLASGLLLYYWYVYMQQNDVVQRTRQQARFVHMARLSRLGEMAAGMAHELNQPLTAILAQCQAALRLLDEEDPDQELIREAMALSAGQARRAGDILNRLRDYVGRAREAVPPTELDLAELVDEALFLLEPEMEKRQVKIRFAVRDDGVRVLVDRVALEQVVHNLLINAADAMKITPPSQRQIEIAIVQRDDLAVLAVNDRGPGIPAEELPLLFQPFHSTKSHGMGLGLSICETLVGEMGGKIAASNRLTGGARFTISLPLAQNES